MFGGSDGYFSLTCLIAKTFIKRGITVLAIAYWNRPGLPQVYEKVPVESVEKAARWLRGSGYGKISLWGISKGAELALIAGSLLTELISCVVAVCPINICCQGIQKGNGKKLGLLDCSSWSFRGRQLPRARLGFAKKEFLPTA